ncbi:hypothetical protein [Sphingobacterium spiritivorum]|uniref:POT-type proton-dependent oligopeptide transporter n=1 Tax=Sphingobacterium spiritivorum TaxID=258 RepID=UPI0021630B37|nr:hypothetical protein [Sphingobacterium spiritivorum]
MIWVLGVWKVHREFTSFGTEVTVSWFQILNSFFIVTLASSFSKLWEKVWNPSGPVKFALGLILVGIGFAALSYGSMSIPSGAKTASVSMIWLVLAYFFHTTGELCLSPVGLSYVSKLSPKKIFGFIIRILVLCFGYCQFSLADLWGPISIRLQRHIRCLISL